MTLNLLILLLLETFGLKDTFVRIQEHFKRIDR